jgi:hypothetical protein
MSRFAQKVRVGREKRELGAFHLGQIELESSNRERAHRKLIGYLRRMEPVVLHTPRWSQAQPFLESVAMELAVSSPSLGCRTLPLFGLRAQPVSNSWRRILTALAELSSESWATADVPYVASNQGFEAAAIELLMRAQDSEGNFALFGHGAHEVPFEVMESLVTAWEGYSQKTRGGRAVTLLLASDTPLYKDSFSEAVDVTLPDYTLDEGVEIIGGRERAASSLSVAWDYSGGVPAIVEALGERVQVLGGVPRSASGMGRCLGPLAEEIERVVLAVAADPILADRIESLGWDGVQTSESIDLGLESVGLVETTGVAGSKTTRLRAKAFAMMLD